MTGLKEDENGFNISVCPTPSSPNNNKNCKLKKEGKYVATNI